MGINILLLVEHGAYRSDHVMLLFQHKYLLEVKIVDFELIKNRLLGIICIYTLTQFIVIHLAIIIIK